MPSPHGNIMNAPYTESSYKWAAAGMLSNVLDLNIFGNVLLCSYHNRSKAKQRADDDKIPGYLKHETMDKMWEPVHNTYLKWSPVGGYGLGFQIVPGKDDRGNKLICAGHSGSAIGQSSVITILTNEHSTKGKENYLVNGKAKGVVVSIVANMQKMDLSMLGLNIALLFMGTDT